MVKLNYAELKFDHLVNFEHDDTVFACAKETGSGHTRIFLVFEMGHGRVYTRNGRADSWEQLFDSDAENIRTRISDIRNEVPVYKISGSHNSI